MHRKVVKGEVCCLVQFLNVGPDFIYQLEEIRNSSPFRAQNDARNFVLTGDRWGQLKQNVLFSTVDWSLCSQSSAK